MHGLGNWLLGCYDKNAFSDYTSHTLRLLNDRPLLNVLRNVLMKEQRIHAALSEQIQPSLFNAIELFFIFYPNAARLLPACLSIVTNDPDGLAKLKALITERGTAWFHVETHQEGEWDLVYCAIESGNAVFLAWLLRHLDSDDAYFIARLSIYCERAVVRGFGQAYRLLRAEAVKRQCQLSGGTLYRRAHYFNYAGLAKQIAGDFSIDETACFRHEAWVFDVLGSPFCSAPASQSLLQQYWKLVLKAEVERGLFHRYEACLIYLARAGHLSGLKTFWRKHRSALRPTLSHHYSNDPMKLLIDMLAAAITSGDRHKIVWCMQAVESHIEARPEYLHQVETVFLKCFKGELGFGEGPRVAMGWLWMEYATRSPSAWFNAIKGVLNEGRKGLSTQYYLMASQLKHLLGVMSPAERNQIFSEYPDYLIQGACLSHDRKLFDYLQAFINAKGGHLAVAKAFGERHTLTLHWAYFYADEALYQAAESLYSRESRRLILFEVVEMALKQDKSHIIQFAFARMDNLERRALEEDKRLSVVLLRHLGRSHAAEQHWACLDEPARLACVERGLDALFDEELKDYSEVSSTILGNETLVCHIFRLLSPCKRALWFRRLFQSFDAIPHDLNLSPLMRWLWLNASDYERYLLMVLAEKAGIDLDELSLENWSEYQKSRGQAWVGELHDCVFQLVEAVETESAGVDGALRDVFKGSTELLLNSRLTHSEKIKDALRLFETFQKYQNQLKSFQGELAPRWPRLDAGVKQYFVKQLLALLKKKPQPLTQLGRTLQEWQQRLLEISDLLTRARNLPECRLSQWQNAWKCFERGLSMDLSQNDPSPDEVVRRFDERSKAFLALHFVCLRLEAVRSQYPGLNQKRLKVIEKLEAKLDENLAAYAKGIAAKHCLIEIFRELSDSYQITQIDHAKYGKMSFLGKLQPNSRLGDLLEPVMDEMQRFLPP